MKHNKNRFDFDFHVDHDDFELISILSRKN